MLAGAAALEGAELLTNGDFEQSISTGWTLESSGGEYTLNRDVFFHGDPDYEAQAHKYLTGYASMNQTVDVSNLNLYFSADVRFSNICDDNTYGYYSASAIRIQYQNSEGTTIGETRIFNGTTHCDWVNTGTLHLIPQAGDEWHHIGILIDEEIQSIPDLNPDDVKRITTSLYAYNTDYC
jgi:hypothetical protein